MSETEVEADDEKEEISANDSGGSGDKSSLGAKAAVEEEEEVGEAAGNAEDDRLCEATEGC